MSIVVQDLVYTVTEGSTTRNILDGISCEVPAGQLVVVTGPSGSGKTTLLYALTGIITPTSGSVLLGDFDVYAHKAAERDAFRLRRTAYIFQHLNLFGFLDVRANIALSHDLKGERVPTEFHGRTDELLRTLRLGDIADKPVQTLSGGEKQRVAIASAFLSGADYIFADEPTGNLDSNNSRVFMESLRERIDESAASVVLVTHDRMVTEYADLRIHITDGRISDDDSDDVAAHGRGSRDGARRFGA
jgi:putative ABC transport system ATP-binding protein